ncbi:MAG: lysylphosphatidylglycerol synthase transmembrane domain-containing protein [Bacteroidales bacterium]|nr:flippase-like domain-containing protein [Bacteroidales bacterium]MDD5816659.1 lysylphosphatidylglycerol synthase transmembrane domain-containing protein [Bacteroidales bacterium]MDY4521889.1 lysylphosphatidylglycerol synthase transmembrane domain-containing protein [Bacteroidales bacterium]
MTDKTKKVLKSLLKICVSAGALCFVFSKIDIEQTSNVIRGASAWWLILALLIYIGSQIISSNRVRGMLAAVPLNIGWWVNVKLYWLGMFYNFFLPGGVGGDGYKVYWLHKRKDAKVKPTVMALLGDRLSGLAAICFYTVIYASFRAGLASSIGLSDDHQLLWLLLLVPIGLWLYWLFFRLLQRCLIRAAFRALLYSFAVQGLQMLTAAAILAGINATGRVGDYLFLFLISSIASAVPVTVGGVGAREVAFMIGSRYLGVDQAFAISLSLLFYAVSLVGALPGLVLAIRSDLIDGKLVPRPKEPIDFGMVIEDASDEAQDAIESNINSKDINNKEGEPNGILGN